MDWYYAIDGQQYGPVSDEEFRRLAETGKITPHDLVWNATMGEQWVTAGSLDDLHFAPPGAPGHAQDPAYDGPPYAEGGTDNATLMRFARESLAGNWGLAIGVCLVSTLITSGAQNLIPKVGWVAGLILSGPMGVGLFRFCLAIARRQRADFGMLFSGFNQFGTCVCAYLLMTLYILLWTLLLIIPGIIASYSYMMTRPISADNPDIRASDALTMSKEMMRGNKWKLFCLFLRFFGWALLCVLTLGIGFLWLMPYINISMAHFYEDVKRNRQSLA
jgi:uncharacterized membrane protein